MEMHGVDFDYRINSSGARSNSPLSSETLTNTRGMARPVHTCEPVSSGIAQRCNIQVGAVAATARRRTLLRSVEGFEVGGSVMMGM